MAPRILTFAGSLRAGSYNKQLANAAASLLREAGAEVTVIDLADFPLPLYDGDLEEAQGLPESARKLKALFREHDGFFIASPEYNGFFSGVLKNLIDWVSRTETDDELPLSAFAGKTAALAATSPGAIGGLRGLPTLRALLGGISVIVVPGQVAVGNAHLAFAEDGALVDEGSRKQLVALTRRLVDLTAKLR